MTKQTTKFVAYIMVSRRFFLAVEKNPNLSLLTLHDSCLVLIDTKQTHQAYVGSTRCACFENACLKD